MRGRSRSCGSIEEIWNRRREDSGEWEEGEGEIFRKSKKTVRSPDLKKGMGKGVEMMRAELRELVKEIKEVRGWREKIKKIKEEIKKEVKEGIKEQGEKLRKDLEDIK